jgi:hypothetical protein
MIASHACQAPAGERLSSLAGKISVGAITVAEDAAAGTAQLAESQRMVTNMHRRCPFGSTNSYSPCNGFGASSGSFASCVKRS